MHRSGTSVLARILRALGLDLGDGERLMKPGPDNPDGFYEHWDFVRLNDSLLAELNGAWDCPPTFDEEWRSRVEHLKHAAGVLVSRNFGHAAGPWGWKDPRNSLTLPFWSGVCPGLSCVVSVRNPLDVADSLHNRHGHSILFGTQLWKTYYRGIAEQLHRVPFIVSHHSRLLQNAPLESRRLAAWLGLDFSEQMLAEISSFIRVDTLANERDESELLRLNDPELVELYRFFSAHAEDTERVSPGTSIQFQEPGQSLPLQIDFRLGGNGQRHAIGGWLAPEHRGTWTTSSSARIVACLSGRRPETIRLRATLQPFLEPGESAREMTVRIGGIFAANWVLDDFGTYEANCPASALDASGNLEIELLVVDRLARGLSSSHPRLGILLESLEILGVGPAVGGSPAPSGKYRMKEFDLDAHWYEQRYEDYSAAVRSGEFDNLWEYHRSRGEAQQNNPNPLFSTAHYADSSQFFLRRPRWGAVEDYIRYGAERGLSPHWLFSESFYREQVPGLKSAIRAGTITGTYLHYLRIGRHAGFRPHPLFCAWYLRSVSKNDADGNGFDYFVDRGHRAGLSASPLFDEGWYQTRYPDLSASFGLGAVVESALQHFCMHGASDGLLPIADLDVEHYARECEKAGIDPFPRQGDLIKHFLEHGVHEGLNPNRFFNSSYYLERNPEVSGEIRQWGLLGPYEHFLASGKSKNLPAAPALVNMSVGEPSEKRGAF